MIEKDCSQLSRKELIDLILALARDEPTSGRVVFLKKLKAVFPGKSMERTIGSGMDKLLEDIQALKESILERIEVIENGHHDELDDWDWEDADYNDEPEMISDEQLEDLAGLFEDAGACFLKGDLRDAEILYHALFDLMDELNELDYYLPDPDIELREERARYARCVYELSGDDQRLEAFATVMDLQASSRYDKDRINSSYPLLQDVIDAGEKDMAGLQDFYPAWKKVLSQKGLQVRPASLLLEAVDHTEGLSGVCRLAREWGDRQPHAYLFWLDRLQQENRWADIIEIAGEALAVLKTGEARTDASKFMVKAAEMSGDVESVLKGKLEQFYSHPCDDYLEKLLTEAINQEQRRKTLAKLLAFFGRQKGMDNNKDNLYLKTLLLAGKLDQAWSMVKDAKSLGWSYGLNIGLVFGSIAAVASDYAQNAGTIERLLAEAANKKSLYSHQFSIDQETQAHFFYREILNGLQRATFSESRSGQCFDWAEKIGRKRVDDIVSNTHRGAYRSAAWVLGSLAEVYATNGEKQKADDLLYEYCKEKYNRHSAFKREVKKTISGSSLLQKLERCF
jgi:hypothetical protein